MKTKINFKRVLNNISTFVKRNAPEICTVVGIGGMASTCYMVHKSSPKFHEAIKTAETPADKVKTTVSVYWPSMLSFGASSACLIAGTHIGTKRYLTMATAAATAQKELFAVQQNILDDVGPDVITAIKNEVNKNDIPEEQIIETGSGKELFYEPMTNHYFRSSMSDILKVQNELNSRMLCDDTVCLATFLSDIGVGSSELAQFAYFDIVNGYSNGCIDIEFVPGSVTLNNEEVLCWEMVYRNLPSGEFPPRWR